MWDWRRGLLKARAKGQRYPRSSLRPTMRGCSVHSDRRGLAEPQLAKVELLLFDAFDIVTRAGVDLDELILIEVERDLHDVPGFEGRGLAAAAGGVAFNPGVGLDHAQVDEVGEGDADGGALKEEDFNLEVVFEEGERVLELVSVDVHLLVILGVHEDQVVVFTVEVLHGALFEIGLAHGVTRAEVLGQDIAADEALVAGFDKGDALARLHMLAFDDDKGFAVDLDF